VSIKAMIECALSAVVPVAADSSMSYQGICKGAFIGRVRAPAG